MVVRTILVHERSSTFHGGTVFVDVQKLNKSPLGQSDAAKDWFPRREFAGYNFHATVAFVDHRHVRLGISIVSNQHPINILIGIITNLIPNCLRVNV
jgi:hypothetical protein